MGAKRAGTRTKELIATFDPQFDKLRLKLKEANQNLDQLKKDNILMRQDISTYEAISD